MTNTNNSPLLTINEAARYLRISRSSMYRLIDKHRIPTVKLLTRGQFINREVLDKLIANPSIDFSSEGSCSDE